MYFDKLLGCHSLKSFPLHNSMTKEEKYLRIIFQVCCHSTSGFNANQIEKATQFLVKSNSLHHIAPLFLANLPTKSLLTPPTLNEIKTLTFQVVANYLKKRNTVSCIRDYIAQSGLDIQIILLKSMGFNDHVYDAATPRGSSDIDILVLADALNKFELLLTKMGFIKQSTDSNPYSGVYENTWSKGKVYLDVHTSLTNPYKYKKNSKDLFTSSIAHPFYKSDAIRVLSSMDNILNLALHFQKDCYHYHHSVIDASYVKRSINGEGLHYQLQCKACRVFENIANNITFNKELTWLNRVLLKALPLLKPKEKGSKFRFNQLLMDFVTCDKKVKLAIYYGIYVVRKLKIRSA